MGVIADLLESPYLVEGVVVALAIVFLSTYYGDFADGFAYRNIPIVGWNTWELTNKKAKNRFLSSAKELIAEGFAQGKSVFQVVFSFRPVIILHPRYLDEVKSHPNLSFAEANKRSFFGGKYPGFEIFSGDQNDITSEIVSKKVSQNLAQLTIPLSKETAATLKDIISEPKEWTPHYFAMELPHIVARISTLVFLGQKSCHDKEWLDVSVNYTIDAFGAARELRQWPSVLRPVVHWFLPSVQRARKHMKVGREIIAQEITRRDLVQGKMPEKPQDRQSDALDWSHEIAGGRPFDPTLIQIGLSLAAIHTTSNLLTNVMYDLAAYREYFEPLRNEIKEVVEEDGVLQKTSITKLKLMDSVLKETQRINPVSLTSIHRYATKDIPLSDGTVIPKGASIVVSSHSREDESIYPDAKTYDGYRFLNKRQEPGNAHRFQLVTTSPQLLGFGYGVHACPGRFFASNEIKILLIHLLMKYDWKFADENQERPKNFEHGSEIICNPRVKLLFKAREPEIDLAGLGEGEGVST